MEEMIAGSGGEDNRDALFILDGRKEKQKEEWKIENLKIKSYYII